MSKVEIIKHPASRIGSNLKQSAFLSVLESLATIILGVLLVVWPEAVIKTIAYIAGTFFIVKGGFQVINYFIIKGQHDFFNNNLLVGTVSILVGVAILVMGEEIASVFRVVIGIWMIYASLVKINTAIKFQATGISNWKYILILALMMLTLGVFVVFYSGAVVALIGWLMILVGTIGVMGDVMFIQHVNAIVDKITGGSKK